MSIGALIPAVKLLCDGHVSCMSQEEQGAWFMGMKGRRYKLCWSGNSDGTGGVGV